MIIATSSKHLLSVFVISIFIILAIASSSEKAASFTKENGKIPPEFSKFKDTLLVVTYPLGLWNNKGIINSFKKNYTGNYKIVKYKKIMDYPAEKYRYVFFTKSEVAMNVNSHDIYGLSFYVVDRENMNLHYESGTSTNAYKLAEAYIKALDIERQK